MTGSKLKTLHIFENYLPNSQNWAFRAISNLEEAAIYICALEYSNPQFVTSKIDLINLPDYVSPDLIMEGGYRHDSILQKIITKFKRKAKLEKYISYLVEKTKELEIDLIHCHFANIGWSFLSLKKRTGLPMIVSFYGFDYESLPHTYPVWEKRYRELFEKADMFICEGTFGASILKSKGCPDNKIKINHLGVELNKIPFVNRTKKENELKLVQICNFYEKKGHIYAIEAFKKALITCPNMTLTFVGGEHDGIKRDLQKLILKEQLQQKILFIDFIDFSLLYNFLESYQVFIHPSCYAKNKDCEGGAPVVLLDAEATGMPVISTLHCDIPEEVIHNKTGLLTPEKNSDALAESIIRFYKMRNDEYQHFSIEARKHMEEKFNAKRNSTQLRAYYSQFETKSTNASAMHFLALGVKLSTAPCANYVMELCTS